MPGYSERSKDRLLTCDPKLQVVFSEVIKHFDHAILEGHRGRDSQNEKYRQGLSRLKWPKSKHNSEPSAAVDAAPYPIDWEDRERFHFFAGFVKGIAAGIGIEIRWGGDWDSDTEVKDNRFDDLPHFELVEK